MSEEYEIIFITEEGRAIKNNKTGKIYHSEFEIIEEKNKEINRLNNIIDELEEFLNKVVETGLGIEPITCKNILNYLQELKENKC